ncbi:MAG: hypothetical protein ACRDJN_15970, partial [Chloroflexota bacterium]
FFEGEEEVLAATIKAEPTGFSGAAWRERRQFWQQRLDSYRRTRRASPSEGMPGSAPDEEPGTNHG